MAALPHARLSPAAAAAAVEGDAGAVFEQLAAAGCPVDARSLYQSTLLHLAARHGHVELAWRLLRAGAAIHALDYGGMRRTALHWACHAGHVAVVEVLLEAGADATVGRRAAWVVLDAAPVCATGRAAVRSSCCCKRWGAWGGR